MKRKLLFLHSILLSTLGLILGSSGGVGAQVTITTNGNVNAQTLAGALVGQGVTMLNPQMGGQCPLEVGTSSGAGFFNFNGNPSDIGIDSGIVLTSGSAANIANPASFFSSATFPGGTIGDPDLTAIAQQYGGNSYSTSEDACVLEFDFVPIGDTIKFDYVFGSEEYPSFACSSYNDVFAFFISGPGMAPGLHNIALVPNTNIPVAINSITNMTGSSCTAMGPGSPFSQYYINNQGNNGQHICYNGFTTVLTAISPVIACDTYHLKLAISDVGDQSYDSGVFLKANSLNSVNVSITPETTEGGNDPVDPHCIRGCKPGKFEFTRPTLSNADLTIHFAIGGDAVNGVDYETIPDSIIIPAGSLTADLDINGLLLPNAVGPKTVTLYILSSQASCGATIGGLGVLDSASVIIYDSLYAKLVPDNSKSCPGDEIAINAQMDPSLNYEWRPAAKFVEQPPTGLTVHARPETSTSYTLFVTMPGTDSALCRRELTFYALVDTPPVLKMPASDTTVCLEDSIDLNVKVLPENVSYDIKWNPATHLRDDTSAHNRFFAPVGAYHYRVIAKSKVSGCADTSGIGIKVVAPASISSITPRDTSIHYGDDVQIHVLGQDVVYWTWSPITGLDDPISDHPLATPLTSTTYTVIGISKYGCRDTAEVHINVNYNPKYQVPNAFTPNGDGLNDYFNIANLQYEKVVTFKVFDRNGQLVFNNDDPKGWNGTFKGKSLGMDNYFYFIQLDMPNGQLVNLKGSVLLLR